MKKPERRDIKLIQEIQEDIPLTLNPYRKIAENLGWKEEEVIKRLNKLKKEGILKRIGGILKHRRAGYNGNGMFVCQVEENKIDTVGNKLTGFSEISHCYQRKSYSGWPYNIYAMVHGRSRKKVEKKVAQIIQEIDIIKYDILFSTEELKKTSMKYFFEEG